MYHSNIEKDEYTLLRHELNLGERILHVIRGSAVDNSNHSDDSSGMYEDHIGLFVRDMQEYKYVSMDMIKRSLLRLEKDSLIYKSGFKEYKVI